MKYTDLEMDEKYVYLGACVQTHVQLDTNGYIRGWSSTLYVGMV